MAAITAAEGVLLCHATLAWLTKDVGARALLVKGHVAITQGLRSPREPVDVDVLVAPDDVPGVIAELERRGWSTATSEATIQALQMHSRTFRHDFWPSEIDVHHRFPGFNADPAAVFDVLWESRTDVVIAGQPVTAPSVSAHAALLGLHALRDKDEAYHVAQLADVLARLKQGVPGWSAAEFSDVVQRIGAGAPLTPLFVALGLEPVEPGEVDPALAHHWEVREAADRAKVVPWLAALQATRGRNRLRLLRHALWLPEAEIRLNEPGLPPGRAAVRRAQARRFGRVLRYGPHVIRTVLATRKGKAER